jgi:hypothetical protein
MRLSENCRLQAVMARAAWVLGDLADEIPYAPPAERESLQAGIAFQRWLLGCCLDA